ncbi:hypothetical protein [Moraxella lacunata]|uniref:hypothetical protein n=1 Tax=Moraxella lacunata TaxID=477 RepID=UPI003EDFB2AB
MHNRTKAISYFHHTILTGIKRFHYIRHFLIVKQINAIAIIIFGNKAIAHHSIQIIN